MFFEFSLFLKETEDKILTGYSIPNHSYTKG